MEGFTLIDAVVAAVIVLSAILAYSRGLVREAMAILAALEAPTAPAPAPLPRSRSLRTTSWSAE